MFARATAVKGTSQRKPARTTRAESREHAAAQQESTETFTPPTFSWNIGDIALSAPASSEKGSERVTRRPALPIQAKLEVGAVDDPLEHEADHVADQVMRAPARVAPIDGKTSEASAQSPAVYSSASSRAAVVQRQCSCGGSCDECKSRQRDDEHGKVQRKAAAPQISSLGLSTTSSGITASPIVNEVLRSPGQPLDAATRAFMEPRFGHDFSRVRIHTDAAAEQSARDVNARAYTAGNHVVFAAGRFAPQTHEGRRLVAHELSHVVQQEGAGGSEKLQRGPGDRNDKPPVAVGVGDDPMEMWKDVVAQRHFQQSQGEVTFGRMKIVDAEGNTVANILSESDKKEHAEEKAIQTARSQLGKGRKLLGGRIVFVTDQTVCNLAGRCRERIVEFAQELGVDTATVTTMTRPALAQEEKGTVQGTGLPPEQEGNLAGPKATAKKVQQRRVEGLDLVPATETIYSRGPVGGGTTGTKPGGTTASGGGGGGEPTVETDFPEATNPRGRARSTSGADPSSGEDFEEGGEGPDITPEEEEAMHGGPHGPGLLQMVGTWLLKDFTQRQNDELTQKTIQMVDEEIPKRLQQYEPLTIVLQTGGDIAYAQVTITMTKTDSVVYDLNSVVVSEWYRQDIKTHGDIFPGDTSPAVETRTETKSFALPLLPAVRAAYARQLSDAIATANAQTRPRLQDCLRRLQTKGPNVPSFSFLGGACLDLLPKGKGPR